MKLIPYVLLATMMMAIPQIVQAGTVKETASYELVGGCDGTSGQVYGNDHVSAAVTLSHIARGSFSFHPLINWAGISTGPTDDGFGGCGLFLKMLNCSSKRGQFTIDDGHDWVYRLPPTIMSFSCVQ